MPGAVPRLCPRGHVVPGGVRECPRCEARRDRARHSSHYAFYTSTAWRALRAQVLAEEPRCAVGCGEWSVDVDHIAPRRVRPELALVRSNLRALCRACHGRITRGVDR